MNDASLQRANAFLEAEVMKTDVVDLAALKQERVVAHDIRQVKIINTGALERPVTVRGLNVTRGARAGIEAAGGKVE